MALKLVDISVSAADRDIDDESGTPGTNEAATRARRCKKEKIKKSTRKLAKKRKTLVQLSSVMHLNSFFTFTYIQFRWVKR